MVLLKIACLNTVSLVQMLPFLVLRVYDSNSLTLPLFFSFWVLNYPGCQLISESTKYIHNCQFILDSYLDWPICHFYWGLLLGKDNGLFVLA